MKATQPQLRFLTGQMIPVKRAAEIMGVAQQTIRRYIELGILDGYRYTPKGWYLVSYNSLVEYSAHLNAGGTPEEFLEKKRAALTVR